MTGQQDDPELRGPSRLATPRVPVVRLNRRILYVIGGALVTVVLAGLVALRAQGSRLAHDPSPQASRAPAPSGERWFDKVPDREPLAPAASTAAPPAPALPPAGSLPPSPTPANQPQAKTLTDAELEAQRRERALRSAMAAPIAAAAFEARFGTPRASGAERSATGAETGQPPAAIVPAAAIPAAQAAIAALPSAPRPATLPPDRPEVLPAAVRAPASRYEVKAGTIIPGVLLTGLNSDLPGQMIAQVRENVFDTEGGQYLLIPQGARLIGLYDHQVAYGQERVLVTWKRVIFPNGSSLSLTDGMPGTDPAGAAGFNDQVNHHLVRVFGNALLLSIFSAGVQLSQIPSFGQGFTGPTAGNVLGAAVGQELGQTSSELIRRGMNIAPTIEIRPGYAFNVMVTQDLVFPGPYDDTVRP
jgi:type IV secretion system protein TrbI